MSIASSLPHWAHIVLPVVVVWELVWKGLGLWRAARRGQTVWFICILVLNTAGILPIVYLLLARSTPKKEDPGPPIGPW